MARFTSQAKVKRALGIPSAVTTHDTYIDDLLLVADRQIISYTGMAGLTSATVSEYYDFASDSETSFTLQNFPVSAVNWIKADGSTLSTDAYYVEANTGTVRLKNLGAFFPEGRQTVQVQYTHGYATVPADLEYAATIICCTHFNRSRHSGFSSEAMGSYRYSADLEGIPGSAIALLSRYIRIFPKESSP